jgi:hypothetical protein
MIRNDEVREAVDQQELVKKVYHTDARVTAMEGEIRQLAGGVSRIETLLLNKQETSPLQWFGIIFSVLTLVGALVWGGGEYIEARLGIIRSEQALQHRSIDKLQDAQLEYQYELGRVHEWKEQEQSRRP